MRPAAEPSAGAADSVQARLSALTPAQRELLRRKLGARLRIRMSGTQTAIWMYEQLTPGTSAYNNPAGLRIRGPLDLHRLREAVASLQTRHSLLRATATDDAGEEPSFVVAPTAELPLQVLDADDSLLDRLVDAAATQPFDLEGGLLWRARFIRLASDDHVVVLTFHHLVSDGWSLAILLRDLIEAYEALPAGNWPRVTKRSIDVGAATASVERSRDRAAALDHWRDVLRAAPARVALDRGSVPGPAGTVPFRLTPQESDGLRSAARDLSISLFAATFAAFAAALAARTDGDELLVTTPVADRATAASQQAVTCLLNTVPVVVGVERSAPLATVAEKIHRQVLAAIRHQLPLHEIRAVHPAARAATVTYNVMFLENNAPLEPVRLGDLTIERHPIAVLDVKHDIALTVGFQRQIVGEVEHGPTVQLRTLAADLASLTRAAAQRLADDPTITVGAAGREPSSRRWSP